MATVYTHIELFRKRAISYFSQCLFDLGDRQRFDSKINDLTRKREFLKEFRIVFAESLTFEQQTYLNDQALIMDKELDAAFVERSLVQGILASLNPCSQCGGVSSFRYNEGLSMTQYFKCSACDGRGMAKES